MYIAFKELSKLLMFHTGKCWDIPLPPPQLKTLYETLIMLQNRWLTSKIGSDISSSVSQNTDSWQAGLSHGRHLTVKYADNAVTGQNLLQLGPIEVSQFHCKWGLCGLQQLHPSLSSHLNSAEFEKGHIQTTNNTVVQSPRDCSTHMTVVWSGVW